MAATVDEDPALALLDVEVPLLEDRFTRTTVEAQRANLFNGNSGDESEREDFEAWGLDILLSETIHRRPCGGPCVLLTGPVADQRCQRFLLAPNLAFVPSVEAVAVASAATVSEQLAVLLLVVVVPLADRLQARARSPLQQAHVLRSAVSISMRAPLLAQFLRPEVVLVTAAPAVSERLASAALAIEEPALDGRSTRPDVTRELAYICRRKDEGGGQGKNKGPQRLHNAPFPTHLGVCVCVCVCVCVWVRGFAFIHKCPAQVPLSMPLALSHQYDRWSRHGTNSRTPLCWRTCCRSHRSRCTKTSRTFS
jgi:hypothetical protein